MDRKSPPLPFTARTRTGLPVSGSGSVNFELVFPPPKFVMRRSAPSRFERYRRSSSGCADSVTASASSQRFCRYLVAVEAVSGTRILHVVLEPVIFAIPPVRGDRLEPFDRERPFDDRARLGEWTDGAGRPHLQADV